MGLASDLMGLGMPGPQAERLEAGVPEAANGWRLDGTSLVAAVGGTDRVTINSSGNLIFAAATQGLRFPIQAVTAAGSNQGDAAAISLGTTVNVTGASGTNGARFPSITGAEGQIMLVINDGGSNLNLYPASGEQILGKGTNNPGVVASGTINLAIFKSTGIQLVELPQS